jgi:hypothetical protein
MNQELATRKRRSIVALSVAGAVCLAALAALGIFEPTHQRFLGVNVADGLAGTAYLSGTTLGVTSMQLLRTVVRPKERAITVRELRRRGGRR